HPFVKQIFMPWYGVLSGQSPRPLSWEGHLQKCSRMCWRTFRPLIADSTPCCSESHDGFPFLAYPLRTRLGVAFFALWRRSIPPSRRQPPAKIRDLNGVTWTMFLTL